VIKKKHHTRERTQDACGRSQKPGASSDHAVESHLISFEKSTHSWEVLGEMLVHGSLLLLVSAGSKANLVTTMLQFAFAL